MAEENSKSDKTSPNKIWMFISVILFIVVLVLGFMLVKDKFLTGDVIENEVNDPIVTEVSVSDPALTALVADNPVDSFDDSVVLSNEEVSLKF